MAEIDIAPLSERLADDEITELTHALEKAGAGRLPKMDEDEVSHTIASGIDDDVLVEFFDRLEAHDVAADIYLPAEFEGTVKVGDKRVGSAANLLEILEEMKDDLLIEDEDDEDEDDDDDDEPDELALIEEQLRQLWKLLYAGAEAAIEKKLPLYVQAD